MQVVTAPPKPGIVTAVEVGLLITTSKYRPIMKPELHRPLAPSVTAAPCQLPPGGSYGVCPLPHWFVLLGKCLL